jgi:hypothetical protein
VGEQDRRRRQLLDDLEEMRKYWELKEDNQLSKDRLHDDESDVLTAV